MPGTTGSLTGPRRIRLTIRGTVQGVGFRPFVYNLAKRLGLKGYVHNTPEGVIIEVEGEGIETFVETLPRSAPPLSRIVDIKRENLPFAGYDDFTIRQSTTREGTTTVPPDIAICEDCLRELYNPKDRRYLYPFINCTNCGPRFTITTAIPYDRPNTTMRHFRMCPDCEREYNDPSNRRYHAQPIACPACGPRVELRVLSREFNVQTTNPIMGTLEILRRGGIVAIKGLGGFHLACDATNEETVTRLRKGKRRSNKPFAIMCPDIESVRLICNINEQEESLLKGPSSPIVVLEGRAENPLASTVSPCTQSIGVMLPYTPLHYLLFYTDQESFNRKRPNFVSLVMTSGNISEEPIVTDNTEAIERLSDMVDAFLLHNRDIYMRADDSVIFSLGASYTMVRRSRGYVPTPIILRETLPDVLGVGGHLKSTFTIVKDNSAYMSQHIGDLENTETMRFFEESLENMKKIYRLSPEVVVSDLHPGYLSTTWAERSGLPVIKVQHHHAHIVSCMAEWGLSGQVIGVAFDGTGYGEDGKIWGAEFLVADACEYERLYHFRYVALPGGEKAIREPWRMAISYIHSAFEEPEEVLERLGFYERLGHQRVSMILKMIERGVNSPEASSAGRLFDAVSALLGLIETTTFEGEPAMLLESFVREGSTRHYPYQIQDGCIDFSQTIRAIVKEVLEGKKTERIATLFHNTIARAVVDIINRIALERGLKKVILSGGVFQNMYLLRKTHGLLHEEGFEVYTHRDVPPNDGGISLGQAIIGATKIKRGV